MSVYEQLTQAGVPVDHHESDLYVKVTTESRDILKHVSKSVFIHQVSGELWYDVPFRYAPFWKRLQERVQEI